MQVEKLKKLNPESSIGSFEGLNSNGDEKEFDMFAQSRNVTYETSKQRYVCSAHLSRDVNVARCFNVDLFVTRIVTVVLRMVILISWKTPVWEKWPNEGSRKYVLNVKFCYLSNLLTLYAASFLFARLPANAMDVADLQGALFGNDCLQVNAKCVVGFLFGFSFGFVT